MVLYCELLSVRESRQEHARRPELGHRVSDCLGDLTNFGFTTLPLGGLGGSPQRARFVGPTDSELIAGVGTYTLEIMESLPDVDVINVPVGAGSGAASASLVAKTINSKVQVIAVQAEQAPAIQRSWTAGHPVTAEMETDAEGLATRVPFENTLRMIRDPKTGIDDFVLVSEEAMQDAVRLLLEHTHNLSELSGAAPLAAAIQVKDRLGGAKVVLVLSGGNISMEKLRRILGR